MKTDKKATSMQDYCLPRNGRRDLLFYGCLLGEGHANFDGCGTDVHIYRTVGGPYIVWTRRWSHRPYRSDKNAARIFSSLDVMHDWLRGDDDEWVGDMASWRAWRAAARRDSAIRAIEYTEVP